MSQPAHHLPAVAPAVTAEIVGALSPRLRKRLDAAITKIADRPVTRDGDTVRITVDDETALELHAPTGVVTTADAIRCDCLLAPGCLHRAAIVSAAPVADPAADPPSDATGQPSPGDGDGDGAGDDAGLPAPPPQAAESTATPEQRAAAGHLWAAGAALLDTGIEGAGAVLQSELLRAAHTAKLAGLPRPAAAAVSVVTALRSARSGDPAHRLADLTAAVRELLGTAHRLPEATGPELAALRGTARQSYVPDGSLRLYGLFTEPLITAGGYAGAITWTAAADGRLYTVSDVAPGGPGRAAAAAGRTVRMGDTALTHRQLSHAGLALSGATVSPTGRLGAGAGVKAVQAAGAAWTDEPLAALWTPPAAEQVARALHSPTPGADLLFLDVTILGPTRETGGDCLLATCEDLTLRLIAAHDHPALAYRDNLRMLAALPGTRLRVAGRLVPDSRPSLQLLAAAHPADPARHVDLGLERLQRADLPSAAPPVAQVPTGREADRAPLHLLRRRLEQAVAAGRPFLAVPGSLPADAGQLRRSALPTGADLLAELQRTATRRARDPFGRLLPADPTDFARAWLAAALYTEAAETSLCAAAWR